jgi:hypothetical protein
VLVPRLVQMPAQVMSAASTVEPSLPAEVQRPVEARWATDLNMPPRSSDTQRRTLAAYILPFEELTIGDWRLATPIFNSSC